MPPLMYDIAGGMFFVPASLLLAAVVVSRTFARRRWAALFCSVAAVLAIAIITVSAEALPWWFYGCWLATIVAWLFAGKSKNRRLRYAVIAAAFTLTMAAASIGFINQRMASLPTANYARLCDITSQKFSLLRAQALTEFTFQAQGSWRWQAWSGRWLNRQCEMAQVI